MFHMRAFLRKNHSMGRLRICTNQKGFPERTFSLERITPRLRALHRIGVRIINTVFWQASSLGFDNLPQRLGPKANFCSKSKVTLRNTGKILMGIEDLLF